MKTICITARGCSSVGRAPRLQRDCRGFDSLHLHHGALMSPVFIWPYRLVVRTSPFHGGNRGSSPRRVTIKDHSSGVERCLDSANVVGSNPTGPTKRACSSAVERCLYTAGVVGSIPTERTTMARSSVGQSARLISVRPEVRIFPGQPRDVAQW